MIRHAIGIPLHPVEHHHFEIQGRWLLFDVNALTVIDSCPLDRVILDHATSSLSVEELVNVVDAEAASADEIAGRITTLVETGFLLPVDQEPVVAPLARPTGYATFMVNVSQRCNLTCPYCYVNKGLFDYEEKPVPRMESATADGLVEEIHRVFPGFQTYGYHFYGGEPLMNFDAIRRIVDAAEAKAQATSTSCDYHITTNGTLLGASIADFMDEHRFTVYFSIDGNRETHDELRRFVNGRGSFEIVERNLAYLRSKPNVHLIGSSVIRRGLPLKKAMELLADHGARQCKAERVRLHDSDELALLGDEHDAYLADVKALIDHYVENLSNGRKPLDFRLSSKILQLLTRTRRDFFCPAGERMFGVSATGEVYPCALHVGRPQSLLATLSEGIDPAKRQAFRKKFSPDNQGTCKTCWTRRLCGGGCSAMVDRFGHEDCDSLRAESEAAIAIYQHFAETDITELYGLVSPQIVKWIRGGPADPEPGDAQPDPPG
ncbi:hypothetical protein A4G26_22305 [Mycobacterium kansasii]|uniref:Anaerobic sulfatase-maturating enzyme n=1 Tax=Mycobacterium innocens TaxID=2341083 RepID=A0A498Q360_9MYCO|nr:MULTISPECIES: radical SAM protein [Mycobacterium]KZS75493.1 hypothetical protein A4G26_22305 [Mycobacterium kansasii]VBA39334.1 Anaerobic sulfatase-maturating enzyme [Mycobacterium innocens]